jgi:hypothetical protein
MAPSTFATPEGGQDDKEEDKHPENERNRNAAALIRLSRLHLLYPRRRFFGRQLQLCDHRVYPGIDAAGKITCFKAR